MYKLMICCFVILFKAAESQHLGIGTANNNVSGIVGFDVQLKWNVHENIRRKPYSIFKVKNKITTQLENTIKYTHQLDDTGIVLTIKNVKLDDAGIYRCALDIAGEYTVIGITAVYSDIELTVTDWEFKWISTTNPVVSRLHKDVELVWKYQSRKMVNEITFIRYNTLTKAENEFGVWTAKGGFKTDVSNVKMVKTTNKEVVELRLELRMPEEVHFNIIYICQVSDGPNVNQNGIQLKMEKPKVYSNTPVIKDSVIEFEWHYEYYHPARAIIFTRHLNAEPLNVGYWIEERFKPTLDGGKDRVKFDKKDLEGGRGADITLKLLNVTTDDFSYTYTCKCVFDDRETKAADVEIEPVSSSGKSNKQPNGTNGNTLFRSDDGWVTIVVVVTTVVVMALITVIVAVLLYRRCNSQWYRPVEKKEVEERRSAQSYQPVQNKETAERDEEYNLHAAINEVFEETDEEDEPVKNDDSGDDVDPTSTNNEQTVIRRRPMKV